MKYFQNQRRKFAEEIEKMEKEKREIEYDEQREILRENNKQYIDIFTYKDTEIKTFYSEYRQSKYKVKEEPLEERKTITISIKNGDNLTENLIDSYDMVKTEERKENYNLNENFTFNDNQNILINNQLIADENNLRCFECGRIPNKEINLLELDNVICPGCGRMTIQHC